MFPALPSTASKVHPSNNSTKHTNNSSVIFRIEHLLPKSSNNASTKRLNKSVRQGVYASQFIPKDTISEAISTDDVLSAVAVESQQPLTVKLANGVISMNGSILRKIKLSEDIYSYNTVFELHECKVRVRVMRDLERDDEIVAWFSEEISLLMSIPFLTPMNIQGNNRYTCHLCHLTFETPNPLKIHLTLGCGRHSLDIIWMRLHYAIKTAANYRQQFLPTSTGPSTAPSQHSPSYPSTSSSTPPANSPQPQRFSAFTPISCTTSTTTLSTPVTLSMTTFNMPPTSTASSNALSFFPSVSSAILPPMGLLQPTSANPMNAAAQIEAIVSNMGASKQGHLCIYCGKMYSRKYGLKIHIRTHTGFKPLKCKFCLRPFGDPSNLNKHVRLHLQAGVGSTAVEGYKCHICSKTLARRRDLQRHIESRHGNESQKPNA